MEGSFSPIVKKIAGEVVGKRKRGFGVPAEVCLEDWWLSKPNDGKGIAVGGRSVEMRRCNNALKEFHSAPTRKRYASREFHSAQVVGRHSCTEIETSDGRFVYLCGFINRSRTQQNGFSSVVCRDFLCGFPFNWESYAAKCVGEESSRSNLEYFAESFLPAALDAYSGAQLHDMVLSLTDAEREILNKKMYDNIMGMLNPSESETALHPSESSPSPLVNDGVPMRKLKNKQQKNTSLQKRYEQELCTASVSPCTKTENQPKTSEMSKDVDASALRAGPCRSGRKLEKHDTKDNATNSPKASIKQRPTQKIRTSKKGVHESTMVPNKSGTEKDVDVSPEASVKKVAAEKASNLKNSRTGEILLALPKVSQERRALRSSNRNLRIADSTQVEGKFDVEKRETCELTDARKLLENLTSDAGGTRDKGKLRAIRLLKELLD